VIELKPEPDFNDVLFVAERMRACDQEEIYSQRWSDDPAMIAQEVMLSGAFRWGAYKNGVPIAMIGAFPKWPGVWSVWSFGTDRWPEVVKTLASHVQRFMLPALENHGAIRAECHAMASNKPACRWLTFLGAKAEATLDNYGKNGQTFVCYSWTRKPTKRA
jgi:hypothetical protein